MEEDSAGKPAQIFAQEFADLSINFQLTRSMGSKPIDIRTLRDEVVAAIKWALDEAGIEIPFLYRKHNSKEVLLLVKESGADDK